MAAVSRREREIFAEAYFAISTVKGKLDRAALLPVILAPRAYRHGRRLRIFGKDYLDYNIVEIVSFAVPPILGTHHRGDLLVFRLEDCRSFVESFPCYFQELGILAVGLFAEILILVVGGFLKFLVSLAMVMRLSKYWKSKQD